MARTTIRTEDITASEVTTAKMATDPTNASNLSSGSVPTAQLGNVDTSGLEDDIALLGFKVASNGSLAKYNLVDQTIDDFQSEAGIDTSTSTSEKYDASGKFYVADSTAASYTAKGGGSGGNRNSAGSGKEDGATGGSGGGGGSTSGDGHTTSGGSSNKNTYSGWTSQGGTGGTGQHVGGSHEGGGAGGSPNTSSPNGGNSSGGTGGSGATGYETGISGSSVYYAGGGRGTGNSYGSNGTGYGNTANRGGGGQSNGSGAGQDGGSGVIWLSYTPSGGSSTQTGITSTGTWTVPSGVTQTDIVMFGGGGPGGYGASSGGGGGGALLRHTTFGLTPGDVWTVTIGAGGTASSSDGAMGTNGGDTTFALNTYDPTMSLVSNSTTAEAVPTKGDMVLTYTNEAGTATINTDIKGYVSRDNGSNWTQGTFVSQGTTGGHTILSFHDLDISSQPSGSTMRYKVETLNQAVGKQTRIQAVSLGWS